MVYAVSKDTLLVGSGERTGSGPWMSGSPVFCSKPASEIGSADVQAESPVGDLLGGNPTEPSLSSSPS